ncbi:uncharacterized protein LOC144887442 [Branchiostoma floridae x Branchiostoma japonicum]
MAFLHTGDRLSTFFVGVTMAAYLIAPIRTCPVNCTCTPDPFMVVTCNDKGFTELPEEIPKNTVTLSLSYNKITILDLRKLYDLESLKRVDFSSNKIKTIYGSFESFKNLFIIDLSYNNIEVITWKTFGNLSQINLFKLTGNPFNCDCNQWNTDLCDCSEDILKCTCNMQWLQVQVQKYPTLSWDVTCENPAKVRGKTIEEVKFTPYWCETKYHRIVGLTVGVGLPVLVLIITAIVLLCRRRPYRCWNTCRRRRMLGESYSHLKTAEGDSLSPSARKNEADRENARNGEDTTAHRRPEPVGNDEAEIHSENEQDGPEEENKVDQPVEVHCPDEPEVYPDQENIVNPEHRSVSERLPPEIANMVVTEQLLNTLAMNLGNEWENLAIDLGLKRAEVETIKEDNTGKTNVQKLNMLLAWKAKQKTKATIGHLVKALEVFGEGAIDEDKYNFFLEPSEATDQDPEEPSNTGPQRYDIKDLPQESQEFHRLIASKLKINLFPLADKEAETQRLKNISEWKANFTSDQTYSRSSEAYTLINDRKNAVCRIEWPNNGRGTGFLIGKKEILTCDHVYQGMLNQSIAISDTTRYKAIFDLHDDSDHTFYFSNIPPLSRDPDSGLDYAILELDSEPNPGLIPPLGGCISDITESTRFVEVIGHPFGGPKRVDSAHMVHVDRNSAIHVMFGKPDTVSYQTYLMLEGSSGSPGFNTDGNVILLHNRGIRPYLNGPSVIEQGIKLTSIVDHARSNLPAEKFAELFPMFAPVLLFGGGGAFEVEELR